MKIKATYNMTLVIENEIKTDKELKDYNEMQAMNLGDKMLLAECNFTKSFNGFSSVIVNDMLLEEIN